MDVKGYLEDTWNEHCCELTLKCETQTKDKKLLNLLKLLKLRDRQDIQFMTHGQFKEAVDDIFYGLKGGFLKIPGVKALHPEPEE